MQLASRRYDVSDVMAAQEFYHSRGWTDGLPVVPPTAGAVEACLDWAMLAPDHLVGVEPVRARAITAEKLGVNAVMAGCLPMHFPVVVAAFTAMLQEPFLLHGATASTGGCAVLVIVNGPIAAETGMDPTFNALASSDRASTAIGRALRLCLINLLDVRPGAIDRSSLGHPGKISYCLAEDEAGSDWLPLADERGMPAGRVLRHGDGGRRAAPADERMDDGSGRNPRYLCGRNARQHAPLFDLAGQLRHRRAAAAARPISTPPDGPRPISARICSRTRASGGPSGPNAARGAVVRDRGNREYAALTAPEDLLVVAAGGPAGGFGAVIPPWLGDKSRAVTVAIGACVDCKVP